MAEVTDLDVVDANNTARFPEGQFPSTVNDGNRALEGMLARHFKDTTDGIITTTGTSTAYVAASNKTLSAYHDGLEISVQLHVATGASPTLNVDAVGAQSMVWPDGTALGSNDYALGAFVRFKYDLDNTNWVTQTPNAKPGSDLVNDTSPQLGGDLDLNGNNIDFPTTANISDCLDEDNMASDSATALATQQSIKAYVDTNLPSQAAQAALEAETNEDTYVPPDLIKHSPGVAKCWVLIDGDASPADSIASYNVTSVTDNGTGDYTITIATDFSSANYAVTAGLQYTTNAVGEYIDIASIAAGSLQIQCRASGSATLTDFELAAVAMFGDQ